MTCDLLRRIARGLYGVDGMRPGIAMSVVLSFALACTFDSSGLESTSGGPGVSSVGPPGPTTGASEADATLADPSGEVASAGESGSSGGTGSASGATMPGPLCGNGVIDPGEDCDGAELAGDSCQSHGFADGTLLCSEQCGFDEHLCSTPGCGDGVIDQGEQCDCGEGPCTAPLLNNTSCTSLPSPAGGNYSGGELSCASPGPCTFDTTACTYCGDGVKNAGEVCEGADLGGQSCMSNGFFAGTLACSAVCMLNTDTCTNCGNQQIDPGEMCDGNDLGGKTCKSVDPSKFANGTISCSGSCDGLDTNDCKSGNCCDISAGKGCEVAAIKDCVCKTLGGCCMNGWGGPCVLAAYACGAKC